jgi:hypothetical protein
LPAGVHAGGLPARTALRGANLHDHLQLTDRA